MTNTSFLQLDKLIKFNRKGGSDNVHEKDYGDTDSYDKD